MCIRILALNKCTHYCYYYKCFHVTPRTRYFTELRRGAIGVHAVQAAQVVASLRTSDPHPARHVREHLLVHHPQAEGDAQVLHLLLPDDPRSVRHAGAVRGATTAVGRRTDAPRRQRLLRLAVQAD